MKGSWTGAGREVVLLHGQPGSAADWELVLPHLPGLRLMVPTRPGYEGSAAGGFAVNTAALLRLLDATGVDRIVLAAHSWAGGVALQTALQAPDRISALCLIGSVGSSRAVTPADRVLALPGIRDGSALAMRLAGHRATRVVAASSGSSLDPEQRQDLEATLAMWATTGAWSAFAVEQRQLVREGPALARQLPRVQVPTVVAIGREDTVVSPAAQLDLAARLGKAEVRLLDGGHLAMLEVPDQVAGAIQRAVQLGRAADQERSRTRSRQARPSGS